MIKIHPQQYKHVHKVDKYCLFHYYYYSHSAMIGTKVSIKNYHIKWHNPSYLCSSMSVIQLTSDWYQVSSHQWLRYWLYFADCGKFLAPSNTYLETNVTLSAPSNTLRNWFNFFAYKWRQRLFILIFMYLFIIHV